MYYDLITSMPHLPHFERADRLPITQLRLNQRLRLLPPALAEQLAKAQSLVQWRPDRLLGITDAALIAAHTDLVRMRINQSLADYVAYRLDQQTMIAAIRRKRDGLDLPATPWGIGPRVLQIRQNWDQPNFGLAPIYPWLPEARELLASGDARGLERLLMNGAWRWLDRCAERNMFSFEAVFSYYFKWDILRAWLACDEDTAKSRFRDLIDKVTHVANN